MATHRSQADARCSGANADASDTLNGEVTFHFAGRDSLSQFTIFLVMLGAGVLPFPVLVWAYTGMTAAIVSVAVAGAVALGLRASITVSSSSVVITKMWFFIPYRRYAGPFMEDVCFGGDWGEPEGASGVVVTINGKEVHIGTPKSMHHLHESLSPLRRREGAGRP